MVLDKCPKAGCQATVKRKGWKPFRSVYGVEYNVKVVSLQYIWAEHGGCSPSAETYWEERMPWEQGLPLPIPRLDETNERSGMVTEELPAVSALNVVWPNFSRF
ncbi:hypothetical protein I309_03393 [Cryptococcus deuterogattii LA55]|nr:hypothetical protein I309_03393 [Cryptococcus deuterogattii LA55]KIR73067.1 hypothetical protein I310_02727 [Cryptococcus deuterogattii CA1014]KIR90156.1 hypothetical protein I304_06092 [Cryptococcus deuterogattii CBS 10090]